MGAKLLLLALFSMTLARKGLASELPPIGLIPVELLAFFHPEEVNDKEHLGFVERQRRASGVDDTPDEEERPIYTLYTQEGAPCILVKTDAIFALDYRTLRHGIKSLKVTLPDEPTLSGSCVRTGITAILNFHWGVFKFSLVFDENPEGNSYYLNKAVLEYNQTNDLFPEATYKGLVVLNTRDGGNFYFTALGKSYVCENGDDQGPLPLYNQDAEISGNLTLFNTKFQPFVKRARGDWGPEDHCLPKATQIMRENVMPYISSLVFSFSVVLMISIYGIIRYFTTKKTAYQFYGEQQQNEEEQGVEGHEMKPVHNMNGGGHGGGGDPDFNMTNGASAMQQSVSINPAPANNPFRKDTTNNPFNQSNV